MRENKERKCNIKVERESWLRMFNKKNTSPNFENGKWKYKTTLLFSEFFDSFFSIFGNFLSEHFTKFQ